MPRLAPHAKVACDLADQLGFCGEVLSAGCMQGVPDITRHEALEGPYLI